MKLQPEAVEKAREIASKYDSMADYSSESAAQLGAERGMAWMLESVCPKCGVSDHPASFSDPNEFLCPLTKTEDGWYKVQFAISRAEWLRRQEGKP